MNRVRSTIVQGWMKLGPRVLPFADTASPQLPFGRLLRLSLFQITVGMAAVLVIGTLNRVMIVELSVPAWIVGAMLSLPLLFAPFRAFIGFKSDHHRSLLGWRRVPYIWFGTLMQFGGFAIMPFALLILSGDTTGPLIVGHISAALAFLLVGAGLHTVQTVGLALATDLASDEARPRVVALLCVMLLIGMAASAVIFSLLLADFSKVRLIQVIQGAAVVTMVLNCIALWKQEARNPARMSCGTSVSFSKSWSGFSKIRHTRRRLIATGLGAAGFAMQDILLEPFGGKIFDLTVSATTTLTAIVALAGIAGLIYAAQKLSAGADAHRVAAHGALVGVFAFAFIIFAAPLTSVPLFVFAVSMIGFGGGLFAHGSLTASMLHAPLQDRGLALGAWGATQATAAGLGIACSGLIHDIVAAIAIRGFLGDALNTPATGYGAVYLIEIILLIATILAFGPLVRFTACDFGDRPSTASNLRNPVTPSIGAMS